MKAFRVQRMSSEATLGRDPAPSSIRYLVLLSAFTSLLTGLSFILELTGTNSQELAFFQTAIPVFTFFFVISLLEWFFLRRSRKMLGPYGFVIAVEIFKTFILNMGSIYYIQMVEGASSSTFLLPQFTSLAILFLLALTKVARTRIDELTQKDLSRNLLNLLPTFLVLALFLGTYITEITGLGTPRQKSSFETYTEKEIDWSMFNTPTWDATYLLENLLDQFTAGLQFPDIPLFNITSDQSNPQEPLAYWRLRTLESYEYTNKPPYTTDWNPADSVKRVLSPVPITPNTTYSRIVSDSDRTARFTVRMPLNYSDSVADVTIHPSFKNYLPATWNGEKGSYISSNTFSLYPTLADAEAKSNSITPITSQAREVFPNAFASDLFGIDANIRLSQTSNQEGIFEYTMDYQQPDIQFAAAFSLMEDQYDDVLDPATWSAIQNLYLQYPNTSEEIPAQSGFSTYAQWAPFVYDNATNYDTMFATQTVFGKAYNVMQEFAPDGNLGLEFDQEMWLGQQLGTMAHPEQYQDYNEWFLRRGAGVSLHFASTYATMMRIMGIPSRVVIGYIGGNDSLDDTWRVVTSRFLHAWTQVLVPIDTLPGIPGGERVDWMAFDPLLAYFADLYGIDIPDDIIPASSEDQAIMIKSDYDLETNGLLAATQYHASHLTDDWLFYRTIISNSTHDSSYFPNGSSIPHGTQLDISVRLIRAASIATWFPESGRTINFYIGLPTQNDTGIPLGSAVTDSQGIAIFPFTHDVSIYGIRPVTFYAEIIFNEGTANEITKSAISFIYYLTFF